MFVTEMAAENPVSETARTPAKPQREMRDSWFNSVVSDALGIALALGSSVGAAVMMIDKNFFRNAEKEKRFQKFHKIRDDARACPETRALKGYEWLERIREIEKTHEHQIVGELKEMGIHGPIEKFKSLHSHQKRDVIFAGAAVMAGAIGLIGTVVGGRKMAAREEELSKKLDKINDDQKFAQLGG